MYRVNIYTNIPINLSPLLAIGDTPVKLVVNWDQFYLYNSDLQFLNRNSWFSLLNFQSYKMIERWLNNIVNQVKCFPPGEMQDIVSNLWRCSHPFSSTIVERKTCSTWITNQSIMWLQFNILRPLALVKTSRGSKWGL